MTDDVVAMDRQELQDLLLHSEDISAFLEDFTAMLAREISDGDAPAWCAVTLLRKRKASTAAASGLEAQALDELQNSFTDGPCMTAIREDTVIRVGDVREDTRWPDYLPAAAEQGVRSILGVPFDLDDDAWAGLNVYSPAPHHFEADVIASIQQEVDRASGALRLAVRLASHREAEHDLHAAMSSHTVISLAAGIIMGQNRCTHAEAMRILKDASPRSWAWTPTRPGSGGSSCSTGRILNAASTPSRPSSPARPRSPGCGRPRPGTTARRHRTRQRLPGPIGTADASAIPAKPMPLTTGGCPPSPETAHPAAAATARRRRRG